MKALESDVTTLSGQVRPASEKPFFTPINQTSQTSGNLGARTAKVGSESFFPPRPQPIIQAKLQVNTPGDSYEQQADAVADQVMRMRAGDAPIVQRMPLQPMSGVQRMCSECAANQEEDAGILRRESGSGDAGGHTAPPVVSQVLASGGGQAMDNDTRQFMETRFGQDFSAVRLHTDSRAAESARAIQARAYTSGNHVVFGAGEYQPGSEGGGRLLAHELVHTIQQNQGINNKMIQRDFARMPNRPGNPVVQLTQQQIEAAIHYNSARFRDPYMVGVIRDVLGVPRSPMIVDEDFVRVLLEYQALWRLPQDGKLQHSTRFRLYREILSEGNPRDAVLFIIEAYRLRVDSRLNDITVGSDASICQANGAPSDAVTEGGAHCHPVGIALRIRFCTTSLPVQNHAEFNHLIRIIGHELVHVPQCAAGTGNLDVDEFEAFHFEVCGGGSIVPGLTPAGRVGHANIALAHFANIPVHLRTAGRIAMRDQLNVIVAAGGVGAC